MTTKGWDRPWSAGRIQTLSDGISSRVKTGATCVSLFPLTCVTIACIGMQTTCYFIRVGRGAPCWSFAMEMSSGTSRVPTSYACFDDCHSLELSYIYIYMYIYIFLYFTQWIVRTYEHAGLLSQFFGCILAFHNLSSYMRVGIIGVCMTLFCSHFFFKPGHF